MKARISRLISIYFGRALDFRVRLFNVLAMAGAVVSLLMGTLSVISGTGLVNTITNYVTMLLSLALLLYARRTGKYQLCYMITIAAIFLFLFPVIFFSAGAYLSGMPSFFVFAVAFTVFMLEGRGAVLFSLLELAVYVVCCLLAFHFPQTVHWLDGEQAILADVITGFITVSLALGVSMYLHFRIYNEQQRRLAEQNGELGRLNRQKSALIADVSHEIRTPLTVISGYAQRARKQIAAGTADEETLRGLLTIQLEAQRLSELAGQLISAPMTRQDDIHPGPVDPARVMEQAAALVRPILEKNSNALLLRADRGCPPAHANAGMIVQVLVNLCTNANRHTENGRIIIAAAQREGFVEFSVADNGGGIDPALMESLFERGVSGDGKSGLGLAICREVVEGHGGEIAIGPAPGGGTCVAFTLPVEEDDKEKEA